MTTSTRLKPSWSGRLTLEQVRAEKARRRLREFVRWAWPVLNPVTPLRWGWHLDAICEHMQAVSERQIKNLLVNNPPRCLKSTACAVCWPAWHWIEWPEEGFITASYKKELATRDAVRSRRVIGSRQYQAEWGNRFKLTGDQNAKERYENDRTGVRLTTSVGGGTGDGGDFSLLDDPHNVEEAESAAVLETTKRWHDEAFYSRVNDARKGGRVVVGHRVGPKDLSGHLLESGDWVHLCLPEEYDPKRSSVTVIGWQDPRTEPGELLRPSTFGPGEVAEAKKKPFAFAAQHNQNPVPREGALYKLRWFRRRFRLEGAHYRFNDGGGVAVNACKHFAVCDPAGGLSAAADHTACGIYAATPANDLLVLRMYREKIALEAIVPQLNVWCGRWPELLFLGMEDGFFQGQLIKEAKRLTGMVAVKSLSPGGKDKYARAIPALTRAEAGQIVLPEEAEWLDGFGLRLAAFTGEEGGDDDEADTLSYAAQIVQGWEARAKAVPPRATGGLPR